MLDNYDSFDIFGATVIGVGLTFMLVNIVITLIPETLLINELVVYDPYWALEVATIWEDNWQILNNPRFIGSLYNMNVLLEIFDNCLKYNYHYLDNNALNNSIINSEVKKLFFDFNSNFDTLHFIDFNSLNADVKKIIEYFAHVMDITNLNTRHACCKQYFKGTVLKQQFLVIKYDNINYSFPTI